MEKLTNNNSSRVWSGLVILIIGLVFFLDNVGLNIPHWVVSWHMLFILIGLLVGYKKNFNGVGWLVMILIGGFFTLEQITDHDFSKYYFAIGFIILGLFLIFKPKKQVSFKTKWKDKFDKSPADFGGFNTEGEDLEPKKYSDADKFDVLESVNVFAGSHQNVYSKNFRGGEVVAVFGGADVNLTQADFEGTIVLDILAIFGGAKIIVPSNWEVKSEVTAIFGGLDDKRGVAPLNNEQPRKTLIIKGVALFGGVDIRNF